MKAKKTAIFISGVGSNLKSLLDQFPSRKPHVYANKKCAGLFWARKRGCSVSIKKLDQLNDWLDLAHELNHLNIEVVMLLGFMKIIPSEFLEAFKGEMVNLHPSLLPKYPGLKSIQRAYNEKAQIGVTLHKVSEGVDEGPILFQGEILDYRGGCDKQLDHKLLDLRRVEQRVHFLEQRIMMKYANCSL